MESTIVNYSPWGSHIPSAHFVRHSCHLAFLISLWAACTIAMAQSSAPNSTVISTPNSSPHGPGAKAAQTPSDAQNSAEVHLENLKLLALGSNDGRIVLLFPDKKMVTLHVGEAVPGTHATLTNVLIDKAVFDEVISPAQGKQAVWMWKGGEGSPARLQRFAPGGQQNVSQHVPADRIVALPAGESGTGKAEKK